MKAEVYRIVKGPFGINHDYLYVIECDHVPNASRNPDDDDEWIPLSAALYVNDVEVDGEISHAELLAVWAAHVATMNDVEIPA